VVAVAVHGRRESGDDRADAPVGEGEGGRGVGDPRVAGVAGLVLLGGELAAAEAITNGRPLPASTSPKASITARSVEAAAPIWAKSWL
jgi:hypothetical protein